MKYIVIDTLCYAFGKVADNIEDALKIQRLMRIFSDKGTGYCSTFGKKGKNNYHIYEYDEIEAKNRTHEDIDNLIKERDKELKELEVAYNAEVKKVWTKYYPLISGSILEHCNFSYGDHIRVIYKKGKRTYSYEGRCFGVLTVAKIIKPYVVADDRFFADYDSIISWEVLGTELQECEGKKWGDNCHQCPYGCKAKYSKVQSSNLIN